MGRIVVDVMLKPEILDPQGQAVGGALPRLGFTGFTEVRQGKRFVLTVDGDVTDEHLRKARAAADTLLSNPVIEDVVSVRAELGPPVAGPGIETGIDPEDAPGTDAGTPADAKVDAKIDAKTGVEPDRKPAASARAAGRRSRKDRAR